MLSCRCCSVERWGITLRWLGVLLRSLWVTAFGGTTRMLTILGLLVCQSLLLMVLTPRIRCEHWVGLINLSSCCRTMRLLWLAIAHERSQFPPEVLRGVHCLTSGA